jgi:ubiquinone/menaquinone biosynthesis C-methylase UbiE
MRRDVDHDELLDGPLPDETLVRGNLDDLARINRRLGGARLSLQAIRRLAGAHDPLSVLDIGTGAVDLPLAWLGEAERSGRRWQITAIDSRPEIITAAVARSPHLRDHASLAIEVHDGRRLPYPDGAFDIAHCSLVVHHLDPEDVVILLGEMRRVARRGVVVNDLIRSRLGYVGAWLWGRLLTGNPLTRHDAPMSVRRAYARDELRAMLAEAGLRPTAELVGFAGHRWAVAALPIERLAPAGDG